MDAGHVTPAGHVTTAGRRTRLVGISSLLHIHLPKTIFGYFYKHLEFEFEFELDSVKDREDINTQFVFGVSPIMCGNGLLSLAWQVRPYDAVREADLQIQNTF